MAMATFDTIQLVPNCIEAKISTRRSVRGKRPTDELNNIDGGHSHY